MVEKETNKKCSLVAEYYYNQDKWVEGSGTEVVVAEIEILCKQGKLKVSREELIHILTSAYPERKNIKDRVIRVVLWARSPKYKLIEEEDGVITIKTSWWYSDSNKLRDLLNAATGKAGKRYVLELVEWYCETRSTLLNNNCFTTSGIMLSFECW